MAAPRVVWIDFCCTPQPHDSLRVVEPHCDVRRIRRLEDIRTAVIAHRPHFACVEYDYPDRFALVAKHAPPPPGVAPPAQWGDPGTVRQRLGDAVGDIVFDRGVMDFPVLSAQHYRRGMERTLAPVVKLVAALQDDPATLAAFRSELDTFLDQYLADNCVRHHYLMTRATKQAESEHRAA